MIHNYLQQIYFRNDLIINVAPVLELLHSFIVVYLAYMICDQQQQKICMLIF